MISCIFAAAAAIAFSRADAEFAHSFASNMVEQCTPRDAGTVRGKIAANWILDRVSAQGADIRRDCFTARTPKGMRDFTNLYCMFKAPTNTGWTVLVSHFDTKPGTNCPGANDGASTSGLLAAFAASLSRQAHLKGNLMLIWTDGEECMVSYGQDDGFWGSRRAAAQMAARGMDVRAVICLDMLGDRDLKITIPANGDRTLAKIALHTARRAGLEGLVELSADTVKDDHVPFLDAGWRAIDLIDFDYGGKPGLNDWWHTPHDTIDKTSVDSLEKSGRLVAELLNLLL